MIQLLSSLLHISKSNISSATRWLLISLILLQYLQCSVSQIEGYSNVSFESYPEDVYTTLSLGTANFHCRVKGVLIATGEEELFEIRFFKSPNTLIKRHVSSSRYGYLNAEDEYDTAVGLYIDPVMESDDGREFWCQVVHMNMFVAGLISEKAQLIVKDGRPPAIPLTEKSTGLSEYTVSWSSVLLPSDGPILQYRALAYSINPSSLVHNETISGPGVFQYTFNGLKSDETYQFSIIGINKYGEGNSSDALLEGTTKASLVPDAPLSLTFTTNPGEGNIIVSVEPPLVDPLTTVPITAYNLSYYQTSKGSSTATDPKTMPASMPHFFLNDLIIGASYTLIVWVLNGAGAGDPLVMEYTVEAYTGTQSASPTATPSLTTSPSTSSSIVLVQSSTTPPPTTFTTTTTIITSKSDHGINSHTTVLALTPSQSITTTITTTSNNREQHSTESIVHTSTLVGSSTPSTAQVDTSTQTTSQPPTTSVTKNPAIDEPNTDANTSLPFNAVVLAIGIIALVIIIAIIVAAVLLVFFCIRSRKDDENFTDFHPSPWTHKQSTNPKHMWDSKDSSIKGSPLSGSLNQSISDDIELPIDRNYLQITSDSPSSIRDEDMKHETRVQAEINGSAGLSSTVV